MDDTLDILGYIPEWLARMLCRGATILKQKRAEQNGEEWTNGYTDTLVTDGSYLISLGSGRVFDLDPKVKRDGLVTAGGVSARELVSSGIWNKPLYHFIYHLRTPIDDEKKETTISAHRLVALVCHHLGIKGWDTENARNIFQALGKEDFYDAFGIKPRTELQQMKLDNELENCAEACDCDHIGGRMQRHSNGVTGFSITAHRENTLRSKVRIRRGDWLFGVWEREYKGGNL